MHWKKAIMFRRLYYVFEKKSTNGNQFLTTHLPTPIRVGQVLLIINKFWCVKTNTSARFTALYFKPKCPLKTMPVFLGVVNKRKKIII